MQGNRLEGDGSWPWLNATVDGKDIVVRGTVATWFGGSDDSEDDGQTASGEVTKGHPDMLGCALPMAIHGVKETAGSPIPKVPWHTTVRVYNHANGKVIEVPVIDLGPNKRTRHALDLTVAAFKALGGSVAQGVMTVDYRIIGGAAFLPK